jgi:hypothetical protein
MTGESFDNKQEKDKKMATNMRIIGVPVQDKLNVWVVDHVLWWPVDDFIGKSDQGAAEPTFRESVDSSLYLDYVGIFNKEEFINLNDRFKAEFLANPNKKPLYDEQQKRMGHVDQYLKKRLDIKWILVEKYEWETGMN